MIKLIFLTVTFLLIAVQPAYSLENVDIITKEFYFEEPVLEKGIDGYDIVMVPSLKIYGNPGMPVLPYKTIELLLPPNSEVIEVDVSPSQEIIINGTYLIEPGQNPVPISKKDRTNFTPPNETIYKSDNPYPKEIYEIISVENVCGYRVLLLNIYPVKYYPKSGNVSFFSEIAVTVKTSEVSNTLAINANENFRGSTKDEKRVADLIDNPETLKKYPKMPVRLLSTTSLPLSSSSYDYVIITNNTLKPTFQELADWKNSSGVNTTIMTVEDISIIYPGADLQEKIRNFIKDAYNSWGIEYVLLGGDTEIIPHRGFYVDMGSYTDYDIPSDLYYAALDGTWNDDSDGLWGEPGEEDLLAEVYVGRAPVGNILEVNNFINKTLAYENLSGSESYLKKTLMVGELLNPDIITWGGDYKDEIKSYLTQPWMSSTLYDRDYPGNDWPKSEIISRINEEQHLINHLGHSYVNYGLKMYNSDINDLTNSNYSLIYTQGCYSGAFDNRGSPGTYYSDCISESFVVEEHGAFAMIANSRYGWYSPGSTNGPSQYFDREFFDAIFNENIRNVGRALQDSKEDNAGLVSSPYMRWCYYEINLLGDPKTVIHEPLPEPHDISLTHFEASTLIRVNEEAVINVTVNNVGQNNENNVEVKLIVDGITEDTQIISTLNSSSSRKLNFNWTTDVEGIYSLTVYAVPVVGEVITSNNYVQTDISVTSAQILLVDDDKGANYETYYSTALNDYGYSYAVWNVLTQGAPATENLQPYEIVIWLTGDDSSTTLTSTDQANLTVFLENGGRLFISGQDIGYDVGSTSFYSDYLHAQYVNDDVNLYDLSGLTGDPITDNINISIFGGDGANNQAWPSEISPNDVYATPIFYYNGDGVGAIRVDTGTYRVVYFAFGFEAVNDRWDRLDLMYRIIRWLDIQPPSVWVSDYGATYVPAGDAVTINAYVYDQSSNVSSVYARIESPDENVLTTIQLFDDGMHYDGAGNDGKYGNSWSTDPGEKDYYVDIIAKDTWNNSAEYDNIDRFTTVPFLPTSDILLVDDSTYESYINYYEGALNTTSYSYNTWDQDLRGVIDSSILNSFKICIWSSPFGGPDSYEQSILREFLDNGGRLFISGQDIGWSLTQNGSVSNPFYSTYLHAQYVSDDVNLYDLSGVSGHPITDNINVSISGGDGANNQAWPSEIDPIAPAESIFHYNEFSILSEENLTLQELPSALQEDINKSLDYSTMGTSSSGTGALRVDNGTYRVAYFAFGFEAINDEWDRTYLMNRIIRWLDIQPPSVWVTDDGATYVPAGNPVTINAYVYDESSNVSSVHARIESPDENIITTIQLFDDGMHYDGSANDGTYGNSWTTDPDEKDYYIDIIANDTWNNSAEYDNIDRFTTVPFTPTSNILLVDDSTYVSYINYYEDSLNYNNYSYDLWDSNLRGIIDSSIINSFKMCIWSSPFGGPDSYEQSVLREFLDNRGRLFISGQDIGYYIGSTSFYSDYLHALYVSDDVNLYDLSGVSGDLITDNINISIWGGDGANNQWFPSEIDPVVPAESIFHYDNTLSKEISTLLRPPSLPEDYLNRDINYNTSEISSSGTAALRIDTGTYRVVYFAFGFEAINSSADRDFVMNRIISRWIDAIPPEVSNIVPTNNTNVSGIQWINATVKDNIGLQSVTANVSNSTWARIYNLTQNGDVWYNDSWNTTQHADGPYTITINATDFAGNQNNTVNITIIINNTPPIQNASGDYSGDGTTDSWDITYLARSIIGIPGYETLSSGDVSGDGVVDAWDCTYLARAIAGVPGYVL